LELIDEALGNLSNVLSGPREMALDIICDYIEDADADPQWLVETLLPMLKEKCRLNIKGEQSDDVFTRTFAIEVLACLVGRDHDSNLLSVAQRKELVAFTQRYLEDETDFRGYVSVEHGWAHSIAHAADLTNALIKNTYIDTSELLSLFDSWQELLKSAKLPFLMFDEDQRIAMALKSAVDNGRMNALKLAVFFDELLDDEEDDWFHLAFRSATALNRFKNSQNLIRSLFLQIQLDKRTTPDSDVLTVLRGLLRKLDAGFYPG